MKPIFLLLLFILVSAQATGTTDLTVHNEQHTDATVTDSIPAQQLLAMKQSLGTALFFDTNLSQNRTMSCSSCHNPGTGFVDQRNLVLDNMASMGDDGQAIGNRNAPSAAYALFYPVFQKNNPEHAERSEFIGGMFWDGRVNTLAEQAGGPPINPIEMGMPSKASVVERVKENTSYFEQLKTIYGDQIFADTEKAYLAITDAIGEFEKNESFFAPFDSKYDRFLRGEYELTILEDLGRSLFFSNGNVNCSTCHKLQREDHPREVFSNFEFHNIGVPANTQLQALTGNTAKDYGLWNNPKARTPSSKGRFKTPILRNVAVTGPYMHNGVFKDLRTVILFYDHYNNPKRVNNPETGKPWQSPEVAENLAVKELQAKAMTDRKVDALVAFLKTLTDRRYESMLQ